MTAVRFRPGPPNSNNALHHAGYFLLVGRTCFLQLIYVQCTYELIAI
jgi:hypothetical protein